MKSLFQSLLRLFRYVWAGPCTLLGLLLALPWLVAGARPRWVEGVLEVGFSGYPLQQHLVNRLPFSAITLGHVVLGVSHRELGRLRSHEHAHVRQYERWGVFFFPAYGLSSLYQGVCGRGLYWHNHFEVQARAQAVRRQRTTDGSRRGQKTR